jgi:hypothetical protein
MDSVWLGLAVSLIVGLLYALIIMGPRPLNPRDTTWLITDPGMYYTGWALFREDPHWHWPLTLTNRIGYPFGENVALMDINPLLAVGLKLFSPLLPETFQYLGIEAVLACALQFFFSLRLFRLLLGKNRLGILLCSLFFLVSPLLCWQLSRHYAACNHWLLAAVLLIYLQAQQDAPRAIQRFAVSSLALAAVAVAINPYLALQVVLVLTAAAASLLWQRRMSLPKAAAFMAALGGTCALVAYSLGLVIAGGRGYGGNGYRLYGLNLLAPLDPYEYGAIFPKVLPQFPRTDSNYFGAGIILLAIFLLILILWRGRKPHLADVRCVVPLLVCCIVLTLLAVTTRVTIGPKALDLDPHQRLTPFLAPLRTTNYLFWFPYYTILAAVLAAPFALFGRWQANALLAAVLAVQMVDLIPLRNWVHAKVNQTAPQPLHSPLWSRLGSVHENLVVLPAWQCGMNDSPGGWDGYRIFGLLAAAQGMRTNSYFSGRYTEMYRDFHCKGAIEALGQQALSPDTAYVVTPALAAAIEKGPSGPGKCHEVDGFFLCSSRLDFGAGGGAPDR